MGYLQQCDGVPMAVRRGGCSWPFRSGCKRSLEADFLSYGGTPSQSPAALSRRVFPPCPAGLSPDYAEAESVWRAQPGVVPWMWQQWRWSIDKL
eukprot:jgi/Botrbrau1/21850/Bobra.0190s0063.1